MAHRGQTSDGKPDGSETGRGPRASGQKTGRGRWDRQAGVEEVRGKQERFCLQSAPFLGPLALFLSLLTGNDSLSSASFPLKD